MFYSQFSITFELTNSVSNLYTVLNQIQKKKIQIIGH